MCTLDLQNHTQLVCALPLATQQSEPAGNFRVQKCRGAFHIAAVYWCSPPSNPSLNVLGGKQAWRILKTEEVLYRTLRWQVCATTVRRPCPQAQQYQECTLMPAVDSEWQ